MCDDSLSTDSLRKEATILARYIVGASPAGEIVERYVQASLLLLAVHPSPEDTAMLAFLRRHPRSLPFLDAAAGLLTPEGLLRRKLQLMVALLETTCEHVDLFTPRPSWRLVLLLRLSFRGMASIAKLLVGLCIYPISRGGV